MGLSATTLGRMCGLSAAEFNVILESQGFLNGDTAAYRVAEKGLQFASETYHQRSTGGYASMNPSWVTRKWDESLLNTLDLSTEAITAARTTVAQRRSEMSAAQAVARALAEKNFLEQRAASVERTTPIVTMRGAFIGAAALAVVAGTALAIPPTVAFAKRKFAALGKRQGGHADSLELLSGEGRGEENSAERIEQEPSQAHPERDSPSIEADRTS